MNTIHYAVMENRKELLFSVTYAITRVHYDNSSPSDLKSIYPCPWHPSVPAAGNKDREQCAGSKLCYFLHNTQAAFPMQQENNMRTGFCPH